LANLPASSQVLSPCPYLDPSLFQYDEKLMSAMMRPRPFTETPIRFTARSRPDRTSFRIQTAGVEPPAAAPGGR
jgi:de-etiolated-1